MSVVTVEKNTYTAEPLYQWDKDQVLEVYGLSLASIPEVHFCHVDMSRAIVRQATMDAAGVIQVEVPNSLLQKPYKLQAFICTYAGSTFQTLYKIEIQVKERAKPADYTLEDDPEVYSFNALENLILNTLADVTAQNDATQKAAAETLAGANTAKSGAETAQKAAETAQKAAEAAQSATEAARDKGLEYLQVTEDAMEGAQAAQAAAETAAAGAQTAAESAARDADDAANAASLATSAQDAAEAAQAAAEAAAAKALTAHYFLDIAVGTAWTADSTNGGYIQTVAVDGILASDTPDADILLGDDIDANTLYKKAWSLIDRVVTSDGSVTLYANDEAPTSAFTMRLKVVR